MPWFRVDDSLHSNKKVLRIPRSRRCAAMGLWLLVGTWSTSNLTDGTVPDYIPFELGGTKRMVDDLVASGLWVVTGDTHAYPKWEEYQPTRGDVEAKRSEHAEKMRQWRESKRGKRAARDEDAPDQDDTGDAPVTRHAPVTNKNVTDHEVVSDGHVTPGDSNVASFPTRPDPTRISMVTSVGALSRANARPDEPPADLEANPGLIEKTLDEFEIWCDRNGKPRPTSATRDTLGRHILSHLAEGVTIAHIRTGLTLWRKKGGSSAAALPSFIEEARNPRTPTTSRNTDSNELFDRAMQRAIAKENQ